MVTTSKFHIEFSPTLNPEYVHELHDFVRSRLDQDSDIDGFTWQLSQQGHTIDLTLMLSAPMTEFDKKEAHEYYVTVFGNPLDRPNMTKCVVTRS